MLKNRMLTVMPFCMYSHGMLITKGNIWGTCLKNIKNGIFIILKLC